MNTILIACPSCGFSKQVPVEKLSVGNRKVTCPKCRGQFDFNPLPPANDDLILGNSPTEWQEWSDHSREETVEHQRNGELPTPLTLTLGSALTQSFESLRKNLGGFLALSLFVLVASGAPWLLLLAGGLLPGETVPLWVLPAVAALLSGFGMAWGYGALFAYVVDDCNSIAGAIGRARGKLLSLAWLGLMFWFVVSGGMVLLVVPGLFFLTVFSFAFFVLFREGETGLTALYVSGQYVKGRVLRTFFRLLVLQLCLMAVAAIPVVGFFASLFCLPFAVVFMSVLYEDLCREKDYQRSTPGAGWKFGILTLATVGHLLFWVPLVIFFFSSGVLSDTMPEEWQRQMPNELVQGIPEAFLEKLPAAERLLVDVGLVDDASTGGGLMLDKSVYARGEEMSIKLLFSKSERQLYNLCVADFSGVCGETLSVDREGQWLGNFSMKAPAAAGSYELRMFPGNSTDRQVAAISFEVR